MPILYPNLLEELADFGTNAAQDLQKAAANENSELGSKIDTLLKMMKDEKEKSFGAKMDRFFKAAKKQINAAGTSLSTTAGKIKKALVDFAKDVKETAGKIWGKFEKSDFGKAVIAGVKATKDTVMQFAKDVKKEVVALGNSMKKFFDQTLAPWFKEKGTAAKKAFDEAWKAVKPKLAKAVGPIVTAARKAAEKSAEIARDGRDMAQIKIGKAAQKIGQRLHYAGVQAEDKAQTRKVDRGFTKLSKKHTGSYRTL